MNGGSTTTVQRPFVPSALSVFWPARTGNGREGSSKFCVPWLTLRLFLGFLPAPRPSWSLSRSAASPLAAILLRSTTLLPLASIAPGAVVVVVVVAVAVAPVAFRSLIAVVYAQSFSSPPVVPSFPSPVVFSSVSLSSLFAMLSSPDCSASHWICLPREGLRKRPDCRSSNGKIVPAFRLASDASRWRN